VGIAIEEDDGNFGNWTFKAQIVTNGVSTSTSVRARSASFTPTNGRHYRLVASTTNASAAYDIYNAKIIVDQGLSASSYYFDASDAATSDPNGVWGSDASAFNGDTSTNAITSTAGDDSLNYLMGEGTNAPTSGRIIDSVRVRIYSTQVNGATSNAKIYTDGLAEVLGTATNNSSTADYGSYVTLSTPSGGWTWQKINDLEIKLYQSGGTGSPSIQVAKVEIQVLYVEFFTKLEPQYLLANTKFAEGTTIQNFDSWWRPGEWSGVSNTYLHAVDSADGSTAAVVVVATSTGSTITNSTITLSTSYDQHATSTSSLTMPVADDGLDVKYSAEGNGNVYGSRILVQVTQTVTISIGGTVYSSEGGSNIGIGKTVTIYKNGSTFVGTDETDGSGVYSIAGGIVSGDILTIYIDGETQKGSTILVSDGTTKSDVNVYGDALVLRDDVDGIITNANVATGWVDDYTDMMATTSGTTNITATSSVNIHVYTGDTYIPGGTVTTQGTGDFRVATSSIAFFDTDNNTIGGDVIAYDSSLVYINKNTTINGGDIKTQGTNNTGNFLYSGGSFTPTVILGGTGNIRDGNATSTFYALTISSTGVTTGSTSFVVDNVLSVNSSGSLILSGGTVTMNNGSSISNSSTLTFSALSIAAGATVTTGSSFSVSGDLTVGASSANFSPSAGTITITGGTISNSGTLAFKNLAIAGSVSTAATFSVTGDMTSTSGTLTTSGGTITVTGDLSVSGTISGTGNITINGGDVAGNGTLNLSGGTFLLDGTGLFGGNSGWTFNLLTFGDGSGVATTTSVGTGSITSATTTVANNQILDAGVSKTWNLTASHEPFQLLGNLLASTSSFIYKGVNNATVTPATYYNLEISPTSGSPTYLLGTTTGQTVTVNNNLTLGGDGNVTLNINNYDPNLDIDGALNIGSGDIFQASNSGSLTLGGNFSNNGTFTHNNGTLTLDTTSAVSTISSAGNMSFYNFSVTTAGKVLQFQKHTANEPIFSFDNNFTITGSSGSPENLITIRSDTPGSQWLVDFNVAQTSVTYIFVRDSGCASGSLSATYSVTNSGGGNVGSCWNIGNLGAGAENVVISVEQGSGGGTLRGGGGAAPACDGESCSTEEGSGGGDLEEGGGQGGGGGASP
jgi:hypothetical protein